MGSRHANYDDAEMHAGFDMDAGVVSAARRRQLAGRGQQFSFGSGTRRICAKHGHSDHLLVLTTEDIHYHCRARAFMRLVSNPMAAADCSALSGISVIRADDRVWFAEHAVLLLFGAENSAYSCKAISS